MNSIKPTQENLGKQFQVNKLVIVLEIVFVFLPFILGLIMSDRFGTGRISLGNNLPKVGYAQC